jgi:hypothetical protein
MLSKVSVMYPTTFPSTIMRTYCGGSFNPRISLRTSASGSGLLHRGSLCSIAAHARLWQMRGLCDQPMGKTLQLYVSCLDRANPK